MLRVCGALLRDHRTAGAGARCAGLPVPGIGYRKTCDGYPTPPFSGGACVSGVYCPRRVMVAVLVSCVLVAGHAVRVSAVCVYPYQWPLRAVCGLYGYCAMCYPLPPYMPPYARIYAGVALCPLRLCCPLCVVYAAYMRIHSASARVGSCPA